MSKITFRIKQIETVSIRADFRVGDESGFVLLDAFVRKPDENIEIFNQIKALAEKEDKVGMLKLLYAGINGLGDPSGFPIVGDAAFEEVANGRLCGYLFTPIFKRYQQHYEEVDVTQVKRGNAGR